MFIWSFPPILFAMFLFLFDFGAVLTLYLLFNRKDNGYKFRTFWIGDTILIPLIGFFSATSLLGVNLSATYLGNLFWVVVITLGGYLLILFSEFINFQNKRANETSCKKPFWLYHVLISGPMFFFVVGPLPLVFSLPQGILFQLLIAICLVLFVSLIYIDFRLPWKTNKRKAKG